MIAEQAVTLAAGDGVALEARLSVPVDPAAGIVIAHPHPLYGGDMDNPVVVRVAEVCAELGLATLRFNFRGVGASTGRHAGGRAEQADVDAALRRIRDAVGMPAAVILAGYSFGAVVAAHVGARDTGLAGLLLIAPPVAIAGPAPFHALRGSATPMLIVAGSHDEYCPREAVERLGREVSGVAVTVIEGANHFFFGKLYPFGEAVRQWVGGLEPRQTGRRG